jgi:hypothetical protein
MIRKHPTNPHFTVYPKLFLNYEITDGLAQSYLSPFLCGGGQNFYVGWNCEGTASISTAKKQSSVIRNLEEFKELYPASRK